MAKKVCFTEKPDITAAADIKTIAMFVRYKRTSMGITLEDAAALCGLSKQAYNNIEKGVENSRIDTLFKALSALGIKLKIDETEAEDEWI